jgi:hypothetical protein
MVAVKDIRVEVCAVWPGNSPNLGVDSDPPENLIVVGDSFKRWTPKEGC